MKKKLYYSKLWICLIMAFVLTIPVIAQRGNIDPTLQQIAYGESAPVISIGGPDISGYSYQWQRSANNFDFYFISGQTSTSYSPGPNQTQTWFYRVYYTNLNNSNIHDYSPVSKIEVLPQFVIGITKVDTNIVYAGTSPGILSNPGATGGAGAITYQWQKRSVGGSFTDISGAVSTSCNPGNLSATTIFRLKASSGSQTIYSNELTVTVYNQLVSGSVSPTSQTINYGAYFDTLKSTPPSGGNGIYDYIWQYSYDNASWGYMNISHGTNKWRTTATDTVYFRMATISDNNTVFSNSVVVNVYPQLYSGVVNPFNIAINYNSGTNLTFSGASGGSGTYSYQWQSSPDTLTWRNIPGATSLSYSTGNLTADKYFRVITTSNGAQAATRGAFVHVFGQLVSVLKWNGGTINYNTSPGAIYDSVSGGAQDHSFLWQQSSDNVSWTNINGAAGQYYTPPPLTSKTYYRTITSSNGVSVTSNVITINVNDIFVVGAISPSSTNLVIGQPSPTLTGTPSTGGTGVYTYQWLYTTDLGVTWIAITGANGVSYTPGNLSVHTRFRRRTTTSDGIISYTNVAVVSVWQPITIPDISPDTVVYRPGLTLRSDSAQGGSGVYTYIWQKSTNGASFASITNANALSYEVPKVTSKTYFRLRVASVGLIGYSDTIVVYPVINPGIITVNNAVVTSGGNATLSSVQDASNGLCSVYTYQWQSSTDGYTWNNIPSATISGITATTWFRRQVICGQDVFSSNTVQVKVANTSAQLVPTSESSSPAGNQPNISMPAYTGMNPNNMNYVRTRTFSKPGITDQATADAQNGVFDVKQVTAYLDGLGRPIQTVSKQATPNLGDLISTKFYDAYGRESQQYLDYTDSLSTGLFRTNTNIKQPAFYNSLYNNQEGYYYSNTSYETSPLNRPLKTTAPGNSWTGKGVGTTITERANMPYDSVVIWKIAADSAKLPYSKGYYAPGTLKVKEIVDENSNRIIQYEDFDGQTVLKKTQLSDQLNPGYNGWASIFYVFDDFGRLRTVIPPKAVEAVRSNWLLADSVAAELCYQYRYDGRGRNIIKKIPGADSVEIIHDKRDRIIAMRDGNLKGLGFWELYYYDSQNRMVLTALFHFPISRNSLVDSVSAYPFNPTNSFPFIDTADLNKQVYTFYDDYSFTGAASYVTTDLTKPQAGGNLYSEAMPSTSGKHTRGLVTGVREQVDYDGQFLMTTYHFNNRGRQVQVISDNTQGGKDITNSLYDFSGKLLSTYLKHTNPKSQATSETRILTMNYYDAGGRLDSVKKRINDNINLQQTLSISDYDELGRQKSKRLGVSNTDLEVLNYEYNIRDWLRGINRSYVSNTLGNANWFGEEISYDFGFDSRQLNGNISGIKWKSKGDGIARANGNGYDNLDRLLRSNFTQQNNGSTNWTKDKIDFSFSGTYDINGNLLSMYQIGMNGRAIQGIDSLKYGYVSQYSNKLKYVTDRLNNAQTKLGDFKEPVKDESQDYWYNGSGNVVKDINKNIDTVQYNHNNLESILNIKNKGKLFYQYRGGKEKVSKLMVDTASPKFVWTHYVGDLVYEAGTDGVDTLRYISTEEGRIRLIYKTGQPVGYTYDYFIKDHLGNVRLVLGTKSDTAVYAATMETNAAAVENAIFSNIDNTRLPKPYPYPTDNTTNPNDYVAKLNGVNGPKLGPSIVLRVMAGDSIAIVCKALYKNSGANTSGNNSQSMVDAILQLFSAGGVSEGVHSSAGSNSAIGSLTPSIYDGLKSKVSEENLSTQPKAYLNFAAFDDQFNLIDDNSGVRQVKGQIDSLLPLEVKKMVIAKTGFIYIYTSNESGQDVYFDNLIVRHYTGPLLEETHYYPYGLTMAGISNKALKGGQYAENKRKYNGIEFNQDFDLDQYDAYFRTLNQQIGRWCQIDPKIESFENFSPYAAMKDNPMLNSDFLGDSAIIGVNGVSYRVNEPTSPLVTINRPIGDNIGYIRNAQADEIKNNRLKALGKDLFHALADLAVINQLDNFVANRINGENSVAQVGAELLGIGIAMSKGKEPVATKLDGSFSLTELGFKDYPNHPNVPKPEGPFRLLFGEEYNAARKAANVKNGKLHQEQNVPKEIHFHEVQPVKFGGSPTNINNKVQLPASEHRPFTNWWKDVQRSIEPYIYKK